jgi:hypothetical protein
MSTSGGNLLPAPLLTTEQLALEAKARELWGHPRVEAMTAKVKALMRAGYGIHVPPAAADRFDAAMDEYAFSYVERVLCRDPNNFCLHYTCHPPYDRPNGDRVPGCRFYGENPDAIYRWGGLHWDRSYRLECRPTGPATTAASFTLMSTYGATTPGDALDAAEIETEADGRFVITIDSSPAKGRPNHLQTERGTRLILVREFLQDWEMETPLAMTLEAKGVSRGGAWDEDGAVKEICFAASEEVYLYFWMAHLYRNLQPNSVTEPTGAAGLGGSSSMATCRGFFQLEENEGVVLEWDPAGAKSAGISALDWWLQPIEAHRIQSSLNSFAATPNADGTITAVVAARDPGIVNWIETDGLQDVLLTCRWQNLPAKQLRKGPRLTSAVVDLDALDTHLPPDIARCTPRVRAARNERRLAAYTRRTGDLESRFQSLPSEHR